MKLTMGQSNGIPFVKLNGVIVWHGISNSDGEFMNQLSYSNRLELAFNAVSWTLDRKTGELHHEEQASIRDTAIAEVVAKIRKRAQDAADSVKGFEDIRSSGTIIDQANSDARIANWIEVGCK